MSNTMLEFHFMVQALPLKTGRVGKEWVGVGQVI